MQNDFAAFKLDEIFQQLRKNLKTKPLSQTSILCLILHAAVDLTVGLQL